MSIGDYAGMLIVTVLIGYAGMRLRDQLDRWHAVGAYRAGSEVPPWGWPVAFALGLAAFGLLLFGPMLAARIIGL